MVSKKRPELCRFGEDVEKSNDVDESQRRGANKRRRHGAAAGRLEACAPDAARVGRKMSKLSRVFEKDCDARQTIGRREGVSQEFSRVALD